MLLNCGVGEDSWESLGQHRDQTGQSKWNQSVLNIHWKEGCWSWSSNTLATWYDEMTHWKRSWCWERLKAGEGDDRGWDDWMASPTRWTWVWANSSSWWWTGKRSVLQSMGLQSWTWRRDWTELNCLPRVPSTFLLPWECATGTSWNHPECNAHISSQRLFPAWWPMCLWWWGGGTGEQATLCEGLAWSESPTGIMEGALRLLISLCIARAEGEEGRVRFKTCSYRSRL